MSPDHRRDESEPTSTQPGSTRLGERAPATEAGQPQMSQSSGRPWASDRDQAPRLVPDTRDDIVVSRIQD
jgi:hypothetical protein